MPKEANGTNEDAHAEFHRQVAAVSEDVAEECETVPVVLRGTRRERERERKREVNEREWGEIDNVAGFSVELELVDGGES